MKSHLIQIAKIIFRVLAVFISGLIAGAIVGGTLAGIYEIVSGQEFVFNGRAGYEGTGQIGFIPSMSRRLVAPVHG